MGHKNVCTNCRRAFNLGTNFDSIHIANCPECGQRMIQVNHKFRPPKRSESKKWEVVKLFLDNGFFYQHIYKIKFQSPFEPYPDNMKDALDFISMYKDQAFK